MCIRDSFTTGKLDMKRIKPLFPAPHAVLCAVLRALMHRRLWFVIKINCRTNEGNANGKTAVSIGTAHKSILDRSVRGSCITLPHHARTLGNRQYLKKREAICVWLLARAYPELILEGGKMKKKILEGAKSHFLLKNTKFFQKLTFFQNNLFTRGGSCPSLPPV